MASEMNRIDDPTPGHFGSEHRGQWQGFQGATTVMQQHLSTAETEEVNGAIAQLKRQFQGGLLIAEEDLVAAGLTAATAHRLRSLQVELDKQLKLATADGLFLGAARQEATVAQRRAQLGDRLERMQRYCAMALEVLE
jgi:hypothetical protein